MKIDNIKWWQNAIIYQVYPRSFADSNNDGNGDLLGIVSKLDYLKFLGVDAIWLSPIYLSPMNDNGYDVSDYYQINPIFGTMDDFDLLLLEANKKGIKIIMDLVTNHTSTYHNWFQKAIKGEKKYQKYYFFSPFKDDKKSSFGGSAWEFVPEISMYYYHYFDVTQADLDWRNPEVRNEISKMVNFWLDKGVAGFRLDAIELIGKDLDNNIFANGKEIHSYLHELYLNSFSKYPDCMTVGEGWPTVDIALDYTRKENQQLDMMFQFETATLDWNPNRFGKYTPIAFDFGKFKTSITKWQLGLENQGWNALFLENHDLGRSVSRYGDEKYRHQSATALATMLFFLKGTIFLYQGQEIGAINPRFEDINDYLDVDSLTKYQELVIEEKAISKADFIDGLKQNSRDNSRTPFQWDDSVNGGFNKGATPWIKVNPSYKTINVQNELSLEESVLLYYKQLISLRKGTFASLLINGKYRQVESDEDLFIYKREDENKSLIVITNYSSKNIEISLDDKSQIIISNYKGEQTNKLHAYQSIVIYKEE